jgi:hypothetical protein
MKRKVRITERQLDSIIKKALREQDDQFMTGPSPEDMAGAPEDEEGMESGGEPDFEAFMSAAQELMGQGITIGGLVDKLCEANNEPEPEPESGEPAPVEPDQAIPSDNQ